MAYKRRSYSSNPFQPRTQVRIWWDATLQGYCITSPWNQQFVDTIKMLVPSSDRAFFDDKKMWCFSEKYLDGIKTLCERLWGQGSVVVITKTQSQQTTSSAPIAKASINDAMAEFMRVLPYEAALKAFRHAAMMLHPDRGGDMTKMSLLNTAWERIRKEVYNER